jgi:hypothetical protein
MERFSFVGSKPTNSKGETMRHDGFQVRKGEIYEWFKSDDGVTALVEQQTGVFGSCFSKKVTWFKDGKIVKESDF